MMLYECCRPSECNKVLKITIFLVAFLLLAHSTYAKLFTPSETFAREFIALSKPISGTINSTIVDSAGYIYISGSHPNNVSLGVFLVKLSENTSELWRKEIPDFKEYGTPTTIDMVLDSSETALYLLLKSTWGVRTALNLMKVNTPGGDESWTYSTVIDTLSEASYPKLAIRAENDRTAIYVTYVSRKDGVEKAILDKFLEGSQQEDLDIAWSIQTTEKDSVSHSSALALSQISGDIYLAEITSKIKDAGSNPRLFVHRYDQNNTGSYFAKTQSNGTTGAMKIMLNPTGSIYVAEPSGYLHKVALDRATEQENSLQKEWTVKESTVSDFDVLINDSVIVLVGAGPGFIVPPEGGSPVMATSPMIAGFNTSNGNQIFRELYPHSSRNVVQQMNTVSLVDHENMVAIIGGSSQYSTTNPSEARNFQASIASFQFDFSRANASTTTESPQGADQTPQVTEASALSSHDRKLTIGVTVGSVIFGMVAVIAFILIKQSQNRKRRAINNEASEESPEDPRSPPAKNLLV